MKWKWKKCSSAKKVMSWSYEVKNEKSVLVLIISKKKNMTAGAAGGGAGALLIGINYSDT